jgi:hypothetical protein
MFAHSFRTAAKVCVFYSFSFYLVTASLLLFADFSLFFEGNRYSNEIMKLLRGILLLLHVTESNANTTSFTFYNDNINENQS